MINSYYQIVIEEVVGNKRYFYDSVGYKFLRHCTGCDLTDISEKERLENTLAMMEMREGKMPINIHINYLFKNPLPFKND